MKMRVECNAKFYKQVLADLKALNSTEATNPGSNSGGASQKSGKQNKKSKNKQQNENEEATSSSSANHSSTEKQPVSSGDGGLVVESDEVNGTECEIILLIDPGLIKKVQETVLSVCKGQASCDVLSLKETVEGDEIIS